MKKNLKKLTETALMLALLITLQWLTKPAGQLVTGSCVNAVLAVTVLVSGLTGGIVVAVLSPILAYLVGIAPQILTVPAIMVGNVVFIALLYALKTKPVAAWLVAAIAKFAALYAIVVWLICGVFSQGLLASGALKPPMLTALPATFSYPQLITALIGGGIALLIAPTIRKALRK